MQTNNIGKQFLANVNEQNTDNQINTKRRIPEPGVEGYDFIEINLKSCTEEELQLMDIDGNGEVTSDELCSIVQDHDMEMERISNEYDDRHKEEAQYAWDNRGAWSDKKNEYMNAKDVLYRDEHPEYDMALRMMSGPTYETYNSDECGTNTAEEITHDTETEFGSQTANKASSNAKLKADVNVAPKHFRGEETSTNKINRNAL